ncbi:MAG: serine/threonine protein kinase [Kofleriaceae bacterium]|nr:serine/threonine protein kinase [Kofleriaceae bacterium]MBP6840643.1 serine/threonine protein kinase [Kofleriaceae bacterium]
MAVERGDDAVGDEAATVPASSKRRRHPIDVLGETVSDGQLARPAAAPASAATGTDGELRPGQHLGRYQLIERLGAGAMGVVWAARDPNLDRMVAIKLVHPTLAAEPDAASRLLREAKAMAKVSHGSVVAVYDAGELDGHLYVAMELVRGTTLGQLMRKRKPGELGDWRRWLHLLLQAGRGLAAAHAAGILHRDFKPDNVLVDQRGRVCVGDFGLAELGGGRARTSAADLEHVDAVDLTVTGALLGTPAYMSAEQLRSAALDARSDQFSFCVACWEALYGERPFAPEPGPSESPVVGLLRAIDRGHIRMPPRTSAVPRRVRDALVRGLATDPSKRWPDLPSLLAAMAPPRRIAPVVALVVAIALVALAIVVVVVRRGGASAGPEAARLASAALAQRRQPEPVVRPLFEVTLAGRIAIAPSGRRIAVSNLTRLDVRDLETGAVWSLPISDGQWGRRVQFLDDDTVLFVIGHERDQLARWHLAEPAAHPIATLSAGEWLGRMLDGDIVRVTDERGTQTLRVIGADGTERFSIPTTEAVITLAAVSPDGRRFAFIEGVRFAGRIAVADLATRSIHRSTLIPELTAVTWAGDRHLVYAVGTLIEPTIHRVEFTADGFSPPRELYRRARGWFGQMAGSAERVIFTDTAPTFRGYVQAQAAAPARPLDAATVAATLGWSARGELLTWNRTTGRVEVTGADGLIRPLPPSLDADPANATRADDVLIAALRRPDGRQLVAVDLGSGAERWRAATGTLFAVRCADDAHPPCFAISDLPATGASTDPVDTDQVVTSIDPATGALGPVVHRASELSDLAVSPDGTRLAVFERERRLVEVEVATRALHELTVPLSTLRSLAYGAAGSLIVGGTHTGSRYRILAIDRAGQTTVLAEHDSEMLALARPSPDRTALAYTARTFSPTLYELRWPAPTAAAAPAPPGSPH